MKLVIQVIWLQFEFCHNLHDFPWKILISIYFRWSNIVFIFSLVDKYYYKFFNYLCQLFMFHKNFSGFRKFADPITSWKKPKFFSLVVENPIKTWINRYQYILYTIVNTIMSFSLVCISASLPVPLLDQERLLNGDFCYCFEASYNS